MSKKTPNDYASAMLAKRPTKEIIAELEAKIIQLEERIAMLELRPYPYPGPYNEKRFGNYPYPTYIYSEINYPERPYSEKPWKDPYASETCGEKIQREVIENVQIEENDLP